MIWLYWESLKDLYICTCVFVLKHLWLRNHNWRQLITQSCEIQTHCYMNYMIGPLRINHLMTLYSYFYPKTCQLLIWNKLITYFEAKYTVCTFENINWKISSPERVCILRGTICWKNKRGQIFSCRKGMYLNEYKCSKRSNILFTLYNKN